MVASAVALDAGLEALLAVAVGRPRPGPLATVVALTAPVAYRVVAGIVPVSELGHLRHVSLQLDVTRPLDPGAPLVADAAETARGRLGATTGVAITGHLAGGGEVLATFANTIQLPPTAASGSDTLDVPRPGRILGGTTDAVVVEPAAVAAWLDHTGDEVPIHREGPGAAPTGEVGPAVPGLLLAARLASRHASPDARSLTVRLRRLVPVGRPLGHRVAIVGDEVRVVVEDEAGATLATARFSRVRGGGPAPAGPGGASPG